MTKNLGLISELKIAIDTLTPIEKACETLDKMGVLDGINLDKARTLLDTLKKSR